MGLDMYLYAERYLSEYVDDDAALKKTINSLFSGPFGGDITHVKATVMYWRKANHIHKWFVDNVQDGEDDCGTYYVSRSKIEELIEACDRVLDDHDEAMSLLPPQDGFFFGSTAIDDWYFKTLEETVEKLVELLKAEDADPKPWNFYYRSSW